MNGRLWRVRARWIMRRLWRRHGFAVQLLAWVLGGYLLGHSHVWVGLVAQAYLILAAALFALLRVAYLRGKAVGMRCALDSLAPPRPRTVRRLELVR